ncbi:MAG: heavy-metal-associated domain-containing protein [Burkholderiaceae bacterium]
MKTIIAVIALSALLSTSALAATSYKIGVNGMVCSFCAQGIEKRLSDMPQTAAVFIDLKQKVVAMELKPGANVDEQVIKKEIIDSGYDVTRIEKVNLSVKEIQQSMKNKP